jgi:hypothetical protein
LPNDIKKGLWKGKSISKLKDNEFSEMLEYIQNRPGIGLKEDEKYIRYYEHYL